MKPVGCSKSAFVQPKRIYHADNSSLNHANIRKRVLGPRSQGLDRTGLDSWHSYQLGVS